MPTIFVIFYRTSMQQPDRSFCFGVAIYPILPVAVLIRTSVFLQFQICSMDHILTLCCPWAWETPYSIQSLNVSTVRSPVSYLSNPCLG